MVDPVAIRSGAAAKLAVHFGQPERPLFGFFHPRDEAAHSRGTGVLLCSPIGTDHTRSDWAYRSLAERLAAAGFPCLRFDLSGTGDSAGAELGAGIVRQWMTDLSAAVRELRARSGVTTIAAVGLRLGATLAAAWAAEQRDVDALVLWSPCVSGAAFVSETSKLHKLYLRIEPHVATAPPAPGDGEEALGIFLERGAIADLSGLDLLQLAHRPARRTLVIDGGGLQGRDALLARLTQLDAGLELRAHPGQKFLVTVSHRQTLPAEVIGSIVGWLQEAYPVKDAPPSMRAPAPPVAGPSGERPLAMAGGRLFGILTPADPGRAKPGRPAILVTNAGCVNRQGPHRMFVTLARRWASLGFDVLRMDLSGIGDSPAARGSQENLTYPASALDDLREAITTLGRDVIVTGLCSGGDYAFQLGAQGGRVKGAWLLNPRTFTVLDLTAVEAGSPPTASSVSDVPRTLREMAGRGVDTVLVVSRGDPGVAYLDAHAGDEMKGLSAAPGFVRLDIDGADHPFTPVSVQMKVGDLLTEHLLARHPA